MSVTSRIDAGCTLQCVSCGIPSRVAGNQVTAMGFSSSENLGPRMDPMLTNGTLTDNGDGTWNVTYAVDLDATLDSRNPTNPLGSLSHLEVGWDSSQQDIRNSLLGFDLSSAVSS